MPPGKPLIKEYEKLAVRSFIKGIRNVALQHRFIGCETETLDKLVDLAEQARSLFGEMASGINYSEETNSYKEQLLICSFCSKENHVRANFPKRLNEKCCTRCGIYGHEEGPECFVNSKVHAVRNVVFALG